MDEGLVRVELDLPRREQLEAGLVEQFGLRDAVVVAAGGRGDVKEELGTAAAAYFEKIAANGHRVGLSCGFTLYQTIRHLHERRFRDLVLYPLSGESTLELVDLFPNTLVGMMAAMPGRLTFLRKSFKRKPPATMAPVLPAETMASTLRSAKSCQQRLMELSGLRRRATIGESSMPMTWVQWKISKRGRASVAEANSGSIWA